MPFRFIPREPLAFIRLLFKWLALLIPVSMVIGSACAFFLWALDDVTHFRNDHRWMLYLLPLAGMFVVALYRWIGQSVEAGNNMILDSIHTHGGGVPARMAPLVLISTLVTHAFGGSAGREGTAVQMGGSIASAFGSALNVDAKTTRVLLMCGIAAGFGAVFGTPVTGAIFAMEVLALGAMRYDALIPCIVASLLGDWTCTAWGIQHTHYPQLHRPGLAMDVVLMLKVLAASVTFGWVAMLFSEGAHGAATLFKKIKQPVLRPVVGAAIVIGLTVVLGTDDFLGLGVTSPDPKGVSIVSSFQPGGAHAWSWFWKLLFTCITISSGFKGGEVTPLFFIGAALGHTIGVALGAPIELFAGLGFIAVFAGAANTPLACTMMGMELFGHECGVYFALACGVAYVFSGHSGIYLSQRIGTPKTDHTEDVPAETLRDDLSQRRKGAKNGEEKKD